jgi:hypothetical protein
MARKINRLNARAAATITKHGRHADGGGLYLSISPNGGRRWVFLFRWHGKPTEIGLGSARDVTLARARELASQARAKLAEDINPKDARRPSKGATFGECADRVIEAMRPSWRNGKHAAQWEMTLRDYAAPLRRLPVDKITTDDVLSVLKPLWNGKPETASRLRGRIERVLDAAKAQGLRNGENPARWRGHLDQLLPGCHPNLTVQFAITPQRTAQQGSEVGKGYAVRDQMAYKYQRARTSRVGLAYGDQNALRLPRGYLGRHRRQHRGARCWRGRFRGGGGDLPGSRGALACGAHHSAAGHPGGA